MRSFGHPLRSPRMAAFVVTLLDFLITAAVSATVVVAFGGRWTFVFGTVTVVMRSPVPIGVIAAALLCLRMLHRPGVPPFPDLLPHGPLFDDAHRRLLLPAQVNRRVTWYALAAVAGSLVWVAPQLRNLRGVEDFGDPLFSAWRIAAVVHQLATDPLHLWNGNIFYPAPFTLTFSDAVLLQSLLGAPLLLAGADPLEVMNVLLVIAFPARGLAYYFVTWRLTGDPQAGLVAALAGAWSPFYADHYSHLELQWTMFVPLALLAGLRLLAAPGWRTGMACGVAIAAQCLACMYVGVMLVTMFVPFAAIVALAWRVRLSRRLAHACGGAAVVLIPIAALLAAGYLQGRESHGDRSVRTVVDGSASAGEYTHAPGRLATYRWQSRAAHRPERELFPGTTPVVLAAFGVVPPLDPVVVATLVSGSAALDWSLGMNGLTYGRLYNLSLVYRGMRVPARFTVMVQAALTLLAGFGAARILRLRSTPGKADAKRGSVASGLICAALCAAVLFDLRWDLWLQGYPRSVPRIYEHVTAKMVLAELPSSHVFDHMYFSTRHWAKLLTGYSGFVPDRRVFDAAEAAFPNPEAVATLRRLGATHIIYNCAFAKAAGKTDEDCERVFETLRKDPSLALVATESWKGSRIRLYGYYQ